MVVAMLVTICKEKEVICGKMHNNKVFAFDLAGWGENRMVASSQKVEWRVE